MFAVAEVMDHHTKVFPLGNLPERSSFTPRYLRDGEGERCAHVCARVCARVCVCGGGGSIEGTGRKTPKSSGVVGGRIRHRPQDTEKEW
jgi:hypothetical protein